MHDILDFYNALWGDSKLYRSIWYGKKGEAPNRSKWFKDTEKAVKFALSLAATPHYNVFHACSLYDRTKRQKAYVKETRAIWLDLDLKHTEFKTVKEMALAYLPKFKNHFLGTKNWVIKTGHGLHVYWIHDQNIENWLELAEDIKQFCKDNDIKADPQRICDISSFMRFPDTWNLKDDKPKKTKIIKKGGFNPGFCEKNAKTTIKKPSKAILDAFKKEDFALNATLTELNYLNSDAEKIISKCSLMEDFKTTGLDASEPLWHQALSVIIRCENGVDLAHEYSAKSSRYNKDETAQKINRLLNHDIGPCLCETFAKLNSPYCASCSHYGKIKSCIQLGAVSEPIRDTLEDIHNKKSKERAEKMMALVPEEVWIVGENGIYRMIDDVPVWVTKIPFYVVDKLSEDYNDVTVLTVIIRAYTELGTITFKVPLKLLADDKKLAAEFNSRGIFAFNKKHFKEYIMAYMQNISHIRPIKTVNSLGWQENGTFVYASNGASFNKKGKPINCRIDTKAASYVRGFEEKGLLNNWKEAIAFYNTDEAYLPHLFSILCSLGSILLPWTSVPGFILSLQGESGSGKTLAHMSASSVWGDPRVAGSLGTKDTQVARLGRSAAVKNLPLRLDEATTLATNTLSGLIYELVNGRGRARATIDGSLSNTSAEWQTITLITTNRPLLEHSMIEITEAERYRILELHVPIPPDIAEKGRKIYGIIEQNYGVAGKKFVNAVIKHKDFTIKTINFYMDRFQKLLDDSKRFWVSCCAVALTAATLANKLGMLHINVPEMYKWTVNIIKNQTMSNYQYMKDSRGFETKEEFVSALRDDLVGHIENVNQDDTAVNQPYKDIKARIKHINDNLDILYVRVPALNEFIKKHYIGGVQRVKMQLNIGEPQTVRLGKITARMYRFELKNNDD